MDHQIEFDATEGSESVLTPFLHQEENNSEPAGEFLHFLNL